ncbi:hypothetical protein [Erythrobacter sp. QSSC1-22B]|uniref:hypothetical protein n=1 Tax=Erythrobacter sp. QSSC1-22B TaxID=1860125 RepID=UPI001F36CB3D|nr:hypothetical protein [Erythrobacter sp. QSSC1-22B]
MWTPLVNGFAFFFDDTTNYIRAADLAAHLVSQKEISTAWTARYAGQLPPSAGGSSKEAMPRPGPVQTDPQFRTHNDISAGLVMTGRSPYIGALMWVGYVTSNFWLFIAFQATLAYFLIYLTLKRFGIVDRKVVTSVVLLLAALTTLPFYNGMLLADAFGAFGILAFLLLSTPGKLTKLEIFLLFMTIVTAVVSHLTHIVLLAGMLGQLVLLALFKNVMKVPTRGWVAAIGGLLIGFVSLQITAFATEKVMGKEPQLLPLMSARFIADGPGRDFLDAGCNGNRFQICRVERGDLSHASAILSVTRPGVGTYLLATPEERRKMGEEDKAFAIAVFLHDPVAQTGAIIRNTFKQLTWVEYTGLNRNCSDRAYCWVAIPEAVGEDMKTTLADKEAWPEGAMDALLKIAVVISLIVLAYCLLAPGDQGDWRHSILRNWVLITFAAMVLMSGFGGAVVEPQWRYISRLIWLTVLFAMIAAILRWEPALAARESAPST